jgi:hypothetical protein
MNPKKKQKGSSPGFSHFDYKMREEDMCESVRSIPVKTNAYKKKSDLSTNETDSLGTFMRKSPFSGGNQVNKEFEELSSPEPPS